MSDESKFDPHEESSEALVLEVPPWLSFAAHAVSVFFALPLAIIVFNIATKP